MKPHIVEQADELRRLFQKGDDEGMLAVLALGRDGGLQRMLIGALSRMDERSATYAAPYIADLAKRLGWLIRDQDRAEEWKAPYSSPKYPEGADEAV